MKKSFGAIAIMGVMGVLLGGRVSALTYQDDVNVQFTFNPVIRINLSDSELLISNLAPGAAADSNVITVSTATNASYGYQLSATVGAKGGTDALVNSVDNTKTFTNLASNKATLTNFDDNTWGYSYCADTAANCGTSGSASWVSGSVGSTTNGYDGLPLDDNDDSASRGQGGVTLLSTDGSNNGSVVQFKIGAKAGANQASGVYNNTINFYAVANPGPVTLAMAYEMANKTQLNGYYKMQDMSSGICNAVDVDDDELQVIDVRDNKVYWIAKLRDGHCWMTQNLDLDLESTPTNVAPLTSENTDLNEYGQNGYDQSLNYYSCSNNEPDCSGGIISYLPGPTREHLEDDNSKFIYDGTYSADPGEVFYGGTTMHHHVGNYYSWEAAVASRHLNTFTTDTYQDVSNNPKNSICPLGWRLPTIGISSPTYEQEGSVNEFARLAYLYNNYAGDSSIDPSGMLSAPLYFVEGGQVVRKSADLEFSHVERGGLQGYYVSSTTRGYASGYGYRAAANMDFYSNYLEPEYKTPNYQDVAYAFSVRCIAR